MNTRELLDKFGSSQINSNEEGWSHCDVRFRQLNDFRFTRVEETLLRSSGPSWESWRIAIVRSSGHVVCVEEDTIALLIPYIGNIQVNRGNEAVVAKPGSMILAGPGERRTTMTPGYIGGLIQIPKDAEIMQAELAEAPLRSINGLKLVSIIDPVVAAKSIIHDLDQGGQRHWDSKGPQPDFKSRIADLVASIAGSARGKTSSCAQASLQKVVRAEEYMKSCLREDISTESIARAANVGVRALQLAFRLHRGCSPKSVLTSWRLAQVRERLLDPTHNATITGIAAECGFSHFGRFSQAYRQKHGELPSQTRARLLQRTGGLSPN